MRRVFLIAVAGAAVVGVCAGVALHEALATRTAQARPALPALYGQATWQPGAVSAPPFALDDQHGRQVSLASFRGRTLVLAFMDSRCTGACPVEAAQLGAAMRLLPRAARPRLVIVGVGLADTPATVAAAVRKWGLPSEVEWLLGPRARRARVWRAYGIDVATTKSRDVAHSDVFYVIDATGDERAAFLTPFVPGLLTHDLRRLAS